jgi:exosortase/archaeosortase family protein
MNHIKKLQTTWQSIPVDAKQFLKRALYIFIIWQLLYNLFLLNGRIIDKPLTDWSAIGAQKIMQIFHPGNTIMVKEESSYITPPNGLFFMDVLYMNGIKIVGVADPCNALELYVLYLGFLITFPSSLKRILLFSFAGILIIYIANIIRLAALAEMYMHQMVAVEIAHHYVFKIIVYALIFGLWVLFSKKQLKYERFA